MAVSLYRKYRPARFEDIIGQDHVARTLVNAIKQDRVSHAYLFTGPRGTGKTSTAKILAMALNCDAGQGKATATPDGTCPHCEAIRRGSAMDVVEMDAASNRGIDDIRDLRDKVHFSPVEGRMKVYIIDEVHMLTSEAFNALLKTLEEPPVHAVFVLATTEPHKVPATILSRCQRFDFRRPSIMEVVEVLAKVAAQESIEVPETSLLVIARAAGGSFRDALGILDQLATYSGGKITLEETLDILGIVQHDLLFEIVDAVREGDTRGALLFVDRLSQGGTDYSQFIKDLLGHLRDLYVTKHAADTPASIAATEEQLDRLRSQAAKSSAAHLVVFIDLLGEALRSIRQGSDPRLELELVLIKVTAQETPPARHIEAAGHAASDPAPAAVETIGAALQDEPADRLADSDTASTTGEVEPAKLKADIDHLRRAWVVVVEAVRKRQTSLAAVLGEGRPASLDGDELVIEFPSGYSFQANQATHGENPRVIREVLREITGKDLKIIARLATEAAPVAAEQDARILSNDELIRALKQVFDAEVIDDGPSR